MATAFSRHVNNHELKIGSTTRALDLMRDADGRAMYDVSTEIPPYRNPLLFSQTNWTGGHRQREYLDPTRYFEGESIDTTQYGRILLGPKIYSVGVSGGDLGANPIHKPIWFESISKWMVATATKVFSFDGNNFVEEEEFVGETISWLVDIDDVMYVCLGNSTKYYYTTNGSDYTQTDLSAIRPLRKDGQHEEALKKLLALIAQASTKPVVNIR